MSAAPRRPRRPSCCWIGSCNMVDLLCGGVAGCLRYRAACATRACVGIVVAAATHVFVSGWRQWQRQLGTRRQQQAAHPLVADGIAPQRPPENGKESGGEKGG